jgi:hypothetical protein
MSINEDELLLEVDLRKDGWTVYCVRDDMRIKRVSMKMKSDRREWKKKTCADPTKWDKGTMMIDW